jgi:hypothetical protein
MIPRKRNLGRDFALGSGFIFLKTSRIGPWECSALSGPNQSQALPRHNSPLTALVIAYPRLACNITKFASGHPLERNAGEIFVETRFAKRLSHDKRGNAQEAPSSSRGSQTRLLDPTRRFALKSIRRSSENKGS